MHAIVALAMTVYLRKNKIQVQTGSVRKINQADMVFADLSTALGEWDYWPCICLGKRGRKMAKVREI